LVKLLFILLLIPGLLPAQKLFNTESRNKGFWWKQSVVVASAMYAGFRRHERDVLRDYYKKGYLRVWPNANQQWSDPNKSRNNKYKNHDPSQGRTRVPVAFTDKYHFSTFEIRLSYSICLAGSLSLWQKTNWKQILCQCLLIAGADIAGNGLSSIIYKY